MTTAESEKRVMRQPDRVVPRFISDNPVAVKELRGRMRGRRAFVILTIYLMVMSLLIALIYSAIAATGTAPAGPNLRQAGKYIFAAVIGVEVFLILFVGPALTSSAISGEKERRTFELLRSTLLSSKRIVGGKLLSALSYVLLLVFASIPLQSIAYLMGGITAAEILLSQLVIVAAGISYALIGLFISSVAKNTLISSVATYSVVIFLTFGIPIVVGGLVVLFESIRYGPVSLSYQAEVLFTYFLIGMAAINLPASLVVSDIFLLQNGSLLGYETTIAYHQVFVTSPWYLTLIIYSMLATLLLVLTIRRVRRIALK